ncbi:MAG: hypothetical protein HUU46_01255 [Candidatus Hydrogenedentes bacterium]|nr:hypothetical protein [Candidatus Hydrogenedentota bacterium]
MPSEGETADKGPHGRPRTAVFVIVLASFLLGSLVALAPVIAIVAWVNRYPTRSDVDQAFSAYSAGEHDWQRFEPLAKLMDKLRHPNSRRQGQAFDYAARRFEETYRETHDEVVASVISRGLNRDICCEVQNGLCQVYEELLHDPQFFDYFRNSREAQMALRACNGANLSTEEVEALVSGEITSMEEFEARFRSTEETTQEITHE